MALHFDPEEQHANQIIEKALPVVMQLTSLGVIKSMGPAAPKQGQEFAFLLYNLALLITYLLNIFLGACLITSFNGVPRRWLAWVHRAVQPLIFLTLAMSVGTVMMGTFLTLLA